MKKIFSIILVIILINACQTEKTSVCKSNVMYLPSYLGFVNYDLSDIDTLYRAMYEPGSNFGILKQLDTFYVTQPIIKGDTILIERTSEIYILNHAEYKIVLPNINKSHNISDIQLGDSIIVSITKGPCTRGHAQPVIRSATSYNIDGNIVMPFKESVNHYIVFVSK